MRLNEMEQLAKEIEEAELPVGSIRDQVMEEMERLKQLSTSSQDYQVLYGYLKLVASLPWSKTTEDRCDLQRSK
jgi:ATP-dependent Lon protease